ncbi:MAG: zinc ribbon domain-containing protein [Chloroflexota bacterium]
MMPIYEFKCQRCGNVSEFLLSGPSDGKKLACPDCGSQNLERLISAPNLLNSRANPPGTTCCGREERCETPACHTDEGCRRR